MILTWWRDDVTSSYLNMEQNGVLWKRRCQPLTFVTWWSEAKLTALISHIGKSIILFCLKLATENSFSNVMKTLLTFGHRGKMSVYAFLLINSSGFLLIGDIVFWLYSFFYRSSRPEVFCKKGVLRHFTKFTRKHLC